MQVQSLWAGVPNANRTGVTNQGKRINGMMLASIVVASFMGPLALKASFLYWKYIKIVEKDISAGKSLMH